MTAALIGTTCATAAPSGQDSTRLVTAHQSNLAEIAAGTAAQKAATTSDVRDLGAVCIQMHTELDHSLTAKATPLGATLPDAPSALQQNHLAAVTAHSGQAARTSLLEPHRL